MSRVHIGLRGFKVPPTSALASMPSNADALRLIDDALGPEKPRVEQNRIAEDDFGFQCRAMRLPEITRQLSLPKSQFPGRKLKRWRFDYGFEPFRVIVEIDGGIHIAGGGAHSHPTDILRNMRKRNDAALLGWAVLAFSTADVKPGRAVQFTMRVLAARGWTGPS